MWDAIGTLIAGLGLFYVGLQTLSDNLKRLCGRRLRKRAAEWTDTPTRGLLWGGIFLLFTQSTAAVTFILVGMIRSGMIGVRQALPVIVGANIACGLIVLIVIVDVHFAAYIVMGVAGIAYAKTRSHGLRDIAGAVFGIGTVLIGLDLMKHAVGPIAETAWFSHLLTWTHGSLLLALVVGTVLSFVSQSSIGVAVIAVSLQSGGLLSFADSMMVVFGANTGSSLLTYVLSAGLQGQARRIAMYQSAYNLIGLAIMLGLFYTEMLLGLPLVRALVEGISADPGRQVACVFLIFNILPGMLLMGILGRTARTLERLWPETDAESASRPKYIHSRAADDPETAADLVALEQTRLVDLLSRTLGLIRNGGARAAVDENREAHATLATLIRDAIAELSTAARLSDETYDRLSALLRTQDILDAADQTVARLATDSGMLSGTEAGRRFTAESLGRLETLAAAFVRVGRTQNPDEIAAVEAASGEDDGVLTGVRNAFIAEDSGLDGRDRMHLLAAANHCERLVWLLRSLDRRGGAPGPGPVPAAA